MDGWPRDLAMKQVCLFATGFLVLFAMGCDLASDPNTRPSAGHSHESGTSHHHGAGHSHGEDGHHHESADGGTVVSIGHSHRGDKVTNFYAEVMPIDESQIAFRLLEGSRKAGLEPLRIEETEIHGYINRYDEPSMSAPEIVFRSSAEKNGTQTFTGLIPESMSEDRRFTVVVPKVTLGGQTTSFDFDTRRRDAAKTPTEESP